MTDSLTNLKSILFKNVDYFFFLGSLFFINYISDEKMKNKKIAL